MMTIDKEKPVRLIRHVGHKGNFYHPRDYLPGELPEELLVEGVVSQTVIPTGIISPIETFVKQEIDIAVESSAAIAASYPGLPVLVVTDIQKIQINKDNADQISTLPNIGSAAALKIVEEREKSLFKDVKDLEKRVPLTRLKWTSIESRLIFDA
jgi:hypothetical protein